MCRTDHKHCIITQSREEMCKPAVLNRVVSEKMTPLPNMKGCVSKSHGQRGDSTEAGVSPQRRDQSPLRSRIPGS